MDILHAEVMTFLKKYNCKVMQSCCVVEIFRVKQNLSNFIFFLEKHIDLGIFEEFIIEIYRNTCFNFQNDNLFINSFEQFF